MTTATFNYFLRVDLTMRTFDGSGTTPKTWSLVNKPLKDSTSAYAYWPILKDIGEITLSKGDPLPVLSTGGFVINNRIGSFGANRKFSDLFQRYTPIEQTVVFYVGLVDNDTDTVSSWTQIAQGLIASCQCAIGEDDSTITFDVRTDLLKPKYLTLEVSSTITGMASAPQASLGRSVPLLIGTGVDCVPIRISADGSTSPKWAWGSCFKGHLKNVNIGPRLYSRNFKGDWERFATGASAISNLFNTTSDASTGAYALNVYPSHAYGLGSLSGGALTTGVRFYAKGNGTGGRVSTANLSVTLLRYDSTTYEILEELARGRTALTAYDASNNAGTNPFDVDVSFDKPVLMSAVDARYQYALAVSCTSWAANELSLNYVASTDLRWVLDAADSASVTNWKVLTGANQLRMKLLGVTLSYTDIETSDVTTEGLTYSTVQFTQTSPGSGQVNPIFDDFPLLLGDTQGLSDYAGGTVLKVHELADQLDYDYSGGTWGASGRWDTSRYSSAYSSLYDTTSSHQRRRSVSGTLETRVAYADFLAELCRATASNVGLLSSGKLFMWPWGYDYSVTAAIPAHDITPISWQTLDASNIVNRVNINMKASSLYRAKLFEGGGRDGRADVGYVYSSDFTSALNPTVSALSADSQTIWGTRQLADVNVNLYPDDQTYLGQSGSVLAEYYLVRFGRPRVYAVFTVPFHLYSTLELFDVITFGHCDYPAYFGTNPEASEPVYEDSTTGRSYMQDGFDVIRAETYRGIIEAKTYLLPLDHAPMIKLSVLVLQVPNDPT